ncbi:oligosaccharide flippase family protein [Pseudomonadales bacterium]|nr:oligosaccharide flippase family protein [Pseudomonadales bacterium]
MLKLNLIANFIGQGWTAFMGLAFIPVYVKYLGVESYGLIGLFALLQAWLRLLDMGLTPTISREMAGYTGGSHTAGSIRDLLRSIEGVVLGVSFFVAGGVALSADWIASSWVQAEEIPVIVVAQSITIMGLVSALRFVESVYRSSIVGLQRQVRLNVINSSMATLRGLGAVVVLVWVSPTIQAFFIWQALISAVTLIIFARTTYASLQCAERSARFSVAALSAVWRFAGGVLGITFLALLLTQVDKILLSKLLTLSDFGFYALAAVVAGALNMTIAPISQAWYPRLCQLHVAGDDEGLVRTFHQGAQLVTVIMGSTALVLIVFSETFLKLWTQDADLALRTAPILRLLVLGNLLNGLMWIPYQTQLAHGWTGLTVRMNIISVLLLVPAILWIVPRHGAEGAAWVWVCLNVGYVLIGVQFMYRRILISEKWRWYIQDLLQPLLVVTAVPVLVYWLVPVSEGFFEQLGTLVFAASLTLVAAVVSAKLVRQKVCSVTASFVESYALKKIHLKSL